MHSGKSIYICHHQTSTNSLSLKIKVKIGFDLISSARSASCLLPGTFSLFPFFFSDLLYTINFLNGSVLQSLKSGPLINKIFLSVVWVEFPVLRTLDKTASARSFKSSS